MERDIRPILSSFIDRRDNAKKSDSTLILPGGTFNQMSRFSQMIDQYHMELFGVLGNYNLTEMEALSELVNSRLNWMRMNHR